MMLSRLGYSAHASSATLTAIRAPTRGALLRAQPDHAESPRFGIPPVPYTTRTTDYGQRVGLGHLR